MYTNHNPSAVEEICYDLSHTEKVLTAIKNNFDAYFQRFVETEAGMVLGLEGFQELQKKFGVKTNSQPKKKDFSRKYINIISNSIEEFEKDRQNYIDIMDLEALEEYEDDVNTFKSSVLSSQCPVIRKTLQSKTAKELDKYRADFRHSNPSELLTVVTNLCEFAVNYRDEWYNQDFYENSINSYKDLELSQIDTDDCTVYGVIGGGIKTMLLYKFLPDLFPSRSRNAIWALWYLTGKEEFGCTTASEFLMVDVKKIITQQNYFYPYELFAYYAYELYKLLRDKAQEMDAYIDPEYRYVIVDKFFDYVVSEHDADISVLKSQIRDGGMGYA